MNRAIEAIRIIRAPNISFWKAALALFVGVGLYFSFFRYYEGLGAVTHLSDEFPWGLWIGFDVLCGVALAAGGFCLAAAVYIFHIERYRPILRSTILTAFLGYLLVCMGLMYDLGRFYNIWRPIVLWNPHSVMFEVAWCVILYTTVLAFEFLPVLLEGAKKYFPELSRTFRVDFWIEVLHRATIPLVILGVILSTLHQSSLGSLFLIVPGKLHPLWYSPLLPFLFFVSAIAVGLSMVNFESFLSSRFLKRGLEHDLLKGLAKANAWVLGIYLVIRIVDLTVSGNLHYAFGLSYESSMFNLEIVAGVIAPMILFAIPAARENRKILFLSSLLVVSGLIMNRINVAITGFESVQGAYFPKYSEIMITVFIVSVGFLVFWMASKYLPVFPEEPGEKPDAPKHRFEDLDAINKVFTRARENLGISAKIVNETEMPSRVFDPVRNQYNSPETLKYLSDSVAYQVGKKKILGIAAGDLYSPFLSFVYGEAQLDGNIALLSTARLRQSPNGKETGKKLFEERLYKEIMHEIGHLYGLRHCHRVQCLMALSRSEADIDIKEEKFCTECSEKFSALQHSLEGGTSYESPHNTLETPGHPENA